MPRFSGSEVTIEGTVPKRGCSKVLKWQLGVKEWFTLWPRVAAMKWRFQSRTYGKTIGADYTMGHWGYYSLNILLYSWYNNKKLHHQF